MHTKKTEKNVSENRRLYIQIARSLEQLIESDRLNPGDQLPAERELANVFEVSRQTIREALIALEVLGKITIKPGSGVYVSEHNELVAISRNNPKTGPLESSEAKACLLPSLAKLAVQKANNEELIQFEALTKQMNIAFVRNELISFGALERRFWTLLVTTCRNTAAKNIAEYFETSASLTEDKPTYLTKRYTEDAMPLYQKLYSTLVQRDPIQSEILLSDLLQHQHTHTLLGNNV